jgi:hypothetical protein
LQSVESGTFAPLATSDTIAMTLKTVLEYLADAFAIEARQAASDAVCATAEVAMAAVSQSAAATPKLETKSRGPRIYFLLCSVF